MTLDFLGIKIIIFHILYGKAMRFYFRFFVFLKGIIKLLTIIAWKLIEI